MPLDTQIQDALNNFGFAQVLVTLQPDVVSQLQHFIADDGISENVRVVRGIRGGTLLSIASSHPEDSGPAGDVIKRFRDAETRLSKGGIDLASAAMAASASDDSNTSPSSPPTLTRVFPRLGVAIGYVDGQAARAIDRDMQNVASVYSASSIGLIHPVQVLEATAQGDLTWGLEALGVPQLWDKGLTGKGVRVGHLDTGVDGTHTAFAEGQIKAFEQFDFSGNPVAEKHNKPFDSGRHGTHTAGTICGGAVEGMKIGVAPGIELHAGMVIEGGDLVRVLSGMEWCVTEQVRILSMSLGYRGFRPLFMGIMQRLEEVGILPVIAIGNEGVNSSRSPGDYPQSVSVGAMANDHSIASFSSSITFNRDADPQKPDVVGPGVNILSAVPGNHIVRMDGTSMATPHIAGVAALLLEKYPQATNAQVREAIYSTCVPLESVPSQRQGHGLVNAPASLEKLQALLT